MDGELVTQSPSDNEKGGRKTPFTHIFEDLCPYYMSIGMSCSDYWDGANELPKYYRDAETLAVKRKDREMWLQGRYVYDALLCASPVFRAFSKAKPIEYHEVPLMMSDEMAEEIKEKRKLEENKAFLQRFSKKFQDKRR